MKKIVLLSLMSIALLSSCGNGSKRDALQAQNDSLRMELDGKNAELDGILAAFDDIQDGFRMINEAENRVDLSGDVISENRSNKIKEDVQFISQKMKENREKIAQLEEQLKKSKYASAQLKKTLSNLKEELQRKEQQVETLQKELASKNLRITELDEMVAGLNQNVNDLVAENEVKSVTVAKQDKALNAAWFVFGTKSELKEQKIWQKDGILKNDDFNKDYFTQIDIRVDKQIKLYAKRAELKTTHPEGSYEFKKDEKGQLTLVITNPSQFWSVSRYLVIRVK